MVHLVAPGWDVIGAGEPGLPGVALGHNQNIAWGFTIFGLDQQDLYLEDLNPSDSSQYKTAQGLERPWRFAKKHSRFVAAPNVQVDLKFTQHGPVLWTDGKRALALHWVGAEPGTAGYLGSLAVDRAQNWQEFEAAMPRWKVPSENIVYADRDGNIGEHSVGLAPLAQELDRTCYPYPALAVTSGPDLCRLLNLPHQFNPAVGIRCHRESQDDSRRLSLQGGLLVGAALPRFSESHRCCRRPSRATNSTSRRMERLQSDVLSLPALQLIDLLRAAVAQQKSTPAADLLLKWNGEVQRDSARRRSVRSLAADRDRETMDARDSCGRQTRPLRTGLLTRCSSFLQGSNKPRVRHQR